MELLPHQEADRIVDNGKTVLTFEHHFRSDVLTMFVITIAFEDRKMQSVKEYGLKS